MEEMRASLGLGGKSEQQPTPEIVSFESLDMATASAGEYQPQQEPPRRPVPDSFVAREYVPPPPEPEVSAPAISDERLRSMVEESVAKIVREVAREVIEKVAWEVIPDLAEMLIKAEIERLKAET